MKLFRLFVVPGLAASALLLAAVSHGEGSTQTRPSEAGKTNAIAAATNAEPAELSIPVSTFDLTVKETKDPFFPFSLRRPVPTPTNAIPAFSPTLFTLKGLSGSLENRLALINNRTLATGEDSEITTANGKIKIHLLAIKEYSVSIRVDGQPDPMEIFLRKNLQ